MKINRVLRLFFLVSVLVVAMTSVSLAAIQDFTLINDTGYTIKNVYICPNGSDEWEKDFLGRALPNGERREIRFGKTATEYWDVRVVFSNGEVREWKRFDMTIIRAITLGRTGDASISYS